MKKLHEDTVKFPVLAYHVSTGDTLWNVTGFRHRKDGRSVHITCMRDNFKESCRAGITTWCDIRNLYAAPEHFTSNRQAKYLLEEDYDGPNETRR